MCAACAGRGNSYRNLVSSCAECNSQKGPRRAEDFFGGCGARSA